MARFVSGDVVVVPFPFTGVADTSVLRCRARFRTPDAIAKRISACAERRAGEKFTL